MQFGRLLRGFGNRENQTATSNNNKYRSACASGVVWGGTCEDGRKEEEQTQEEIDFLKNWNKNTQEWEIEKDGDNCILGKTFFMVSGVVVI
jgi:hypothetical protein